MEPWSGHNAFWEATLPCLFILRSNRQKEDLFQLFVGPGLLFWEASDCIRCAEIHPPHTSNIIFTVKVLKGF